MFGKIATCSDLGLRQSHEAQTAAAVDICITDQILDRWGLQPQLLNLIVLAVGLVGLFAGAQGSQVFGTLAGHVTISPLVPELREGELEPTPAPEVYAAQEIVVLKSDGKTEVMRIKIDSKGDYRAELPVGTYLVYINHAGIDTAAGLPQEVEISSQTVTRVDIEIDTGIR